MLFRILISRSFELMSQPSWIIALFFRWLIYIYIHIYIYIWRILHIRWLGANENDFFIYVSTKTVDLIVNRRTYITIKTTHDCDEMCVARLRTFQWVSFGLTSNLYIDQYYIDFVGNHVYHVFCCCMKPCLCRKPWFLYETVLFHKVIK